MSEDKKAPLHQENDRRYQALFRNVELIQDLLIHCVDEPWVAEVDMDAIELQDTKALTGQLARRDADIIYKLPFKDGTLSYLALFLEFQSQPDRFMALRISTYKHLFWEKLVAMKQLSPNKKLPPVFGLVMYNGTAQWSSPKQLRNLIDLPKESPLWPQQPQAQYQLIDEKRVNDYHKESISHHLFQIEFCEEPKQLVVLVGEIQRLIVGTPGHKRLSQKIAQWFSAATFEKLQLELPLEQFDDLEGVNHMLSKTVERWTEEWKQQGVEKGREQGIDEGREQGIEQRNREIAIDMLKENVDDAFIVRITKITSEQLQELKQHLKN